MKGRVLAVDPGEKRIGIAISDPTRVIATPLTVINHVQMVEDCRKILQIAKDREVTLILIGQALGEESETTRQARHAQKIAGQLRLMSDLEIILWDESYSTQQARQVSIATGAKKKDRTGHMDDRAAAIILQDYLETTTGQEHE